MLIRYKKDSDGSSVPVADIYTAKEHAVDPRLIDKDAVWAIRKLKHSGAEAYIVGGAVRDLMLGRQPKDFDIATSATPRQVQKLFWNARIIGKRFKLVHLVFKDKILEVSTFRSGEDGDDDGSSVYGTVEQDAKRRDFTVNALYYDPTDSQVLDFNHSMRDFRKRKIRSILPLPGSFSEDPVRMIRAIKYSVTTGFSLQFDIRRAIRKRAGELARVSSSRLTEEVTKILSSGDSSRIIAELQKYRLLVFLLPCISVYTRLGEISSSLDRFDEKLKEAKRSGESVDEGLKGEMLSALVRPMIVWPDKELTAEEAFKEVYGQVKTLISPMTPPNYDVERSVVLLLESAEVTVPKHCLRARRPIRQPGTMGFKGKSQKHGDHGRKVRKGQTQVVHSTRRRKKSAPDVHQDQ